MWVFLFPTTLITSTTSTGTVQNVGTGAGVGLYWSVGSAATLNGPTFAGNVLAPDIVSSDGSLTIGCGRRLSSEKQVTLNQDNISIGYVGIGFGSGGFDQGVDIGSGGTGGSGATSSRNLLRWHCSASVWPAWVQPVAASRLFKPSDYLAAERRLRSPFSIQQEVTINGARPSWHSVKALKSWK